MFEKFQALDLRLRAVSVVLASSAYATLQRGRRNSWQTSKMPCASKRAWAKLVAGTFESRRAIQIIWSKPNEIRASD
jgi:hypothetical protein